MGFKKAKFIFLYSPAVQFYSDLSL